MQSKRQPKRTARLTPRRRPRITLETLDQRLLLNASTDWVSPDTLRPFIPAGYGEADATYADPDGAARLAIDTNDMAEALRPQGDLSDGVIGAAGTLSYDNLTGLAAQSSGTSILYLDFDGGKVTSRTGDFWLGSDFVYIPAYSLSTFGWAGREQESINYISQFIREDYAAYNINITTTKPGSGEYTTMYIGGGNSWFRADSGVIGVATYDVGNVDPSNYGFAFTDELSIYYDYAGGSLLRFSEYVANLVTHESAHTFGANHVNDTTEIMNPYLPLTPHTTTFGRGPISGGSGTQDTQTLLGKNIGYAHGADDFGNSSGAASVMAVNSSTSGLLERRDDVDAFRFTAVANENMTVDIDTTAYGNLNSYVKIYRNSTSGLIAENNDNGTSLDAVATFDAVAGETYTALVSSSTSGSSGSYTLNMLGTPPTPEPDIVVTDNSGASDDLSIDFDSLTVNTTASATVTITNHGTANLVLTQLTTTSPFHLSVTSAAGNNYDNITITPGGHRDVTVTFTPGSVGNYSGTITLAGNDADQPLVTLALAGSAHAPRGEIAVTAPDEDISDGTLDFGAIVRGTGDSHIITVHNTGLDTLTISGVSTTAPFTWDGGTAPVAIAPGDTFDLNVEAIAAVRGSFDGQLTILSNDPEHPATTLTLTAQGLAGVLAVHEEAQTADDSQMDFGAVRVGTEAGQTIVLSNNGDADLTISDLGITGGFTLEGAPGETIILAAGQSLALTVGYAPGAMGNDSGAVLITSDGYETDFATVSLQGQGVAGVLAVAEVDGVDDGSTEFGRAQTGLSTARGVWQLTNNGNIPVTINLALANDSDFEISGDHTIVLAAGNTRTVDITFNTNLARTLTDALTLTCDDLNGTTETLALSADAYALIGAGSKYQFLDQSGDRVTLTLSGAAQAEVIIGQSDQPDIQSINLLSGSGKETLSIKVSGPGRTRLGEVTGTGSLNQISGAKVDLVGNGIDVDGNIHQVNLGSVLGGADLHFRSDIPASLRLQQVVGDSDIDIDGFLRQFRAEIFVGGSLRAAGITGMDIAGQLNADVEAAQGNIDRINVRLGNLNGHITAQGNIGNVTLGNGDLLGELTAAGDIGRVMSGKGGISGVIQSAGAIGRITAGRFDQADIIALTRIDQINVNGDMNSSTVTVGYDHLSAGMRATATSETGAYLGAIKVKGVFAGSTVAVGVAPDAEGNFINGSASSAGGSIGLVNLQQVNTVNNTHAFGVIAQDAMAKLRVNQQNVPPGFHQDDFYIAVLNQ